MPPIKDRKLFLIDHCLTPHENIPNSGILCENDRIIATGGATAFLKEPGMAIYELNNCFAMPGLIDSHIHGAGGFDVLKAAEMTNDDMNGMSMYLAAHGVTSFFPTLECCPKETLLKNIDALTGMIGNPHPGAEPSGIHLEGPFINPQKAGVQNPEHVFPIDLGFARELFEAGRSKIKLMTFAPELENADKLVELMLEYGVIPSMGHSLAEEEDVYRMLDLGVCRCTHLFNGMQSIHHRKSGLALVALTDDRVSVEIIADGGHVHPRIVDLVSRTKPKEKIIGISNAILPPKSEPGAIQPESGVVTTRDGIIAGATATLESGWLHLTNFTKMSRTQAAACFSSNPAADLGLITRGDLIPGKKADITFFDKKTNKVCMTVIRGKIVYRAGETSL